jgi:hypothetical protein
LFSAVAVEWRHAAVTETQSLADGRRPGQGTDHAGLHEIGDALPRRTHAADVADLQGDVCGLAVFDAGAIRKYVRQNRIRLSALSRREALKNIG